MPLLSVSTSGATGPCQAGERPQRSDMIAAVSPRDRTRLSVLRPPRLNGRCPLLRRSKRAWGRRVGAIGGQISDHAIESAGVEAARAKECADRILIVVRR